MLNLTKYLVFLKARLILCCINGLPFSEDVLKLCEKFRNEGVVAIDIAGNEAAISAAGGGTLLLMRQINTLNRLGFTWSFYRLY